MAQSQRETPISTLAVQIVQKAIRPDVAVEDLARLAQADAAFAMRLLSIVNSAAYGLPHKVADVPQAASLLGIRGLRNIALSLSLSQMIPMGSDGEVLLANSLRRAVAARLIAVAIGIKRGLDDYFTTGLLLEAGLLSRAANDLPGAAQLARSPALSRPTQERVTGVEPHPVTGAQMAEAWQLPDDIVGAIRHHHDDHPPDGDIPLVAWTAERIAGIFEGGDLESGRKEAAKAAKLAGVTREQFAQILADVPPLVTAAASAFQRSIGDQPDMQSLLHNANAQLVELNRNFQMLVRKLERLLSDKERLMDKLERANERLSHIASTDGLTGLANHSSFQDALRRDLHRADRAGRPLSITLFDVDHFKQLNDNYGHQAGDAVLRAMGQLLLASVRTGDVAARYGGEEFVVILPDTDQEGALLLAERLRAAIEAMCVKLGAREIKITASFGVCSARERCRNLSAEIIARADGALYRAKDAGRNIIKNGGVLGEADNSSSAAD